ncbi:hypothetical protein D1007_56085 [Hordeum vulgare]|nr:hypothetical protein D1007_56085 [Hordeum vulgare]
MEIIALKRVNIMSIRHLRASPTIVPIYLGRPPAPGQKVATQHDPLFLAHMSELFGTPISYSNVRRIWPGRPCRGIWSLICPRMYLTCPFRTLMCSCTQTYPSNYLDAYI